MVDSTDITTTDSHSLTSSKRVSARQRLREQRELEERRRFGLSSLAVDVEASAAANTTVEISPNVPQALAQAPWFYQVDGPTLSHQRLLPSASTATTVLHDAVDKVVVTGKASGYSAGACQNCGSRTHRTKDCFQAKKKVGAKYSGKVTGVDMQLLAKPKDVSYAQKRDRFIGEVGVNLFAGEGIEMEGEVEDRTTGDGCASRVGPASHEGQKKRKLEQDDTPSSHLIFAASGPAHGGVEIKEVPKYLQNLDAMERGDVFFDPKTGSMRGNPNASLLSALESHDHSSEWGRGDGKEGEGGGGSMGGSSSRSTALFQGDLSRYQSGDYHLYVERQHRFLTGATSSFVDFELDRAVGVLKKQQEDEVKKLRRKHFSDEDEADESEADADGNPSSSLEANRKGDTTEEEKVSFAAMESAAIALGLPVSQCVGGSGAEIREKLKAKEKEDLPNDSSESETRSISAVVEELFGVKDRTHE